MTEEHLSKQAFKNWIDKRHEGLLLKSLTHQSDCIYRDEMGGRPLIEYPCHCYDHAVFIAGWNAAKQQDNP